jgi:hypothetical protein
VYLFCIIGPVHICSPPLVASSSEHDTGSPEMQNPSATILQLYHAGQLSGALRALEHLPAAASLSAAAYAALVNACSRLRSLSQGRLVHRHLLTSGDARLAGDTILSNHLITMYGRCAAPDAARAVFDGMPDRNPVSWAAVIAAHAQNSRCADALGLFSSLLLSGAAPDQFALGSTCAPVQNLGI